MTDPREESVTDLATPSDVKAQVVLKLDAELLAEAQRQLGVVPPEEAVDEALRRLVDQERAKRDAARARLKEMYDSGDLEFRPLGELDE
jgi:Arc/MetJ family transcription regulator